MEYSEACEERHEKLNTLWHWYAGNGETGAAKKVERHDEIVHMIKGFGLISVLASIIAAISGILAYLKP